MYACMYVLAHYSYLSYNQFTMQSYTTDLYEFQNAKFSNLNKYMILHILSQAAIN